MREQARQFVAPVGGLACWRERREDAYVKPVGPGRAVNHPETSLAQAPGGCHSRHGAWGEVTGDQDRSGWSVHLAQDHGKLGLSDVRAEPVTETIAVRGRSPYCVSRSSSGSSIGSGGKNAAPWSH